MPDKENIILMGPFVGELYWEAGRFAPMLPYLKEKHKCKFAVFTREDRFDLYGDNSDILVPLRIQGDYIDKSPNCFRLDNFDTALYEKLAVKFRNKYSERFKVIRHIYPNIDKGKFVNKNQFSKNEMIFKYLPRIDNYNLVNNFLPDNNKPIVLISPRYRKGFKRNWKHWKSFYDMLYDNKELNDKFNFVLCGKPGEYIPDNDNRFLDMNQIEINGTNSSLVGLLLVLLEKCCFVFGSQSAIPNMALLYKKEVLEFGCQKQLHSVAYNIFNSPITFIENRNYDIDVNTIFNKFKTLVEKHSK